MIIIYPETGTFWSHNRTGAVYRLESIDERTGLATIADPEQRRFNLNVRTLENLYSEIGDVDGRHIFGEHSHPDGPLPVGSIRIVDEGPEPDAVTPDPASPAEPIEIVFNPIRKRAGRPQKAKRDFESYFGEPKKIKSRKDWNLTNGK